MPDSLEDLLMTHPATADRPLLGVIVLVVEDSRFACDALRLICHRSGARIRRAESLASATRHLRTYRPRVAIIDLGLPDGSGLSLISELSNRDPRIEAIIATSGDDTLAEAAMEAGADIFLPKPFSSISAFQATVLSLLPDHSRPARLSVPLVDRIEPDPIALRDDLSLAVDLLTTDPDQPTLAYLAAFLASLAQTAADPSLDVVARRIAGMGDPGAPLTTPRRIAAELRERIGTLEIV